MEPSKAACPRMSSPVASSILSVMVDHGWWGELQVAGCGRERGEVWRVLGPRSASEALRCAQIRSDALGRGARSRRQKHAPPPNPCCGFAFGRVELQASRHTFILSHMHRHTVPTRAPVGFTSSVPNLTTPTVWTRGLDSPSNAQLTHSLITARILKSRPTTSHPTKHGHVSGSTGKVCTGLRSNEATNSRFKNPNLTRLEAIEPASGSPGSFGSGRGSTTNNHDCRSALIWLGLSNGLAGHPTTCQLKLPGCSKTGRYHRNPEREGMGVNGIMDMMNIGLEGSDPRPSIVIPRRKQEHDAVQHPQHELNAACSACSA